MLRGQRTVQMWHLKKDDRSWARKLTWTQRRRSRSYSLSLPRTEGQQQLEAQIAKKKAWRMK
jgi:hypothetical protein